MLILTSIICFLILIMCSHLSVHLEYYSNYLVCLSLGPDKKILIYMEMDDKK